MRKKILVALVLTLPLLEAIFSLIWLKELGITSVLISILWTTINVVVWTRGLIILLCKPKIEKVNPAPELGAIMIPYLLFCSLPQGMMLGLKVPFGAFWFPMGIAFAFIGYGTACADGRNWIRQNIL